jgi:hypothetical protein
MSDGPILVTRLCLACTNPLQHLAEEGAEEEWLPCANPECSNGVGPRPTWTVAVSPKLKPFSAVQPTARSAPLRTLHFRRAKGGLLFFDEMEGDQKSTVAFMWELMY